MAVFRFPGAQPIRPQTYSCPEWRRQADPLTISHLAAAIDSTNRDIKKYRFHRRSAPAKIEEVPETGAENSSKPHERPRSLLLEATGELLRTLSQEVIATIVQ